MNNDCWLIDSGATSQFTHNPEALLDIHAMENACYLPNGEIMKVQACGTGYLSKGLVLHDELLVLEFIGLYRTITAQFSLLSTHVLYKT